MLKLSRLEIYAAVGLIFAADDDSGGGASLGLCERGGEGKWGMSMLACGEECLRASGIAPRKASTSNRTDVFSTSSPPSTFATPLEPMSGEEEVSRAEPPGIRMATGTTTFACPCPCPRVPLLPSPAAATLLTTAGTVPVVGVKRIELGALNVLCCAVGLPPSDNISANAPLTVANG